MEPGHEDREYTLAWAGQHARGPAASMEPGHEDREYRPLTRPITWGAGRLNGARS